MEWQSIVGTIFGIFLMFCIPVMLYVVFYIGGKLVCLHNYLHKKNKYLWKVILFLCVYGVLILIMR
jgi:hypothetical protein